MKKTLIYTLAFSLAFFLTGMTDVFAHNGGPKHKYKKVVVHKPMNHITYHRPAVVRSGYVWIDGHYRWDRRTRSYIWIDGTYVRQQPGKVWVAGQWVKVRGGWVYQPGSWRVSVRF